MFIAIHDNFSSKNSSLWIVFLIPPIQFSSRCDESLSIVFGISLNVSCFYPDAKLCYVIIYQVPIFYPSLVSNASLETQGQSAESGRNQTSDTRANQSLQGRTREIPGLGESLVLIDHKNAPLSYAPGLHFQSVSQSLEVWSTESRISSGPNCTAQLIPLYRVVKGFSVN